ncbi:MAG: serine/threonine-protein kinase [Pseudomonadota bacterium]|nr:serine/threonine-protein kinase [Pseudomonadota bacterium]
MSANLIGALLDSRFRVTERFAGGATAWVYRAEDTRTGAKRAVKVLVDAAADDVHARFRGEMALLSGLHHPYIVPVHAVGVIEGLPFMVMDLVEGGSVLELRNDDGPLLLEDVCVLAIQVLSALAEAHRHGIVHRDVKPGNVLVDDAGNARLCDFGIARYDAAQRDRLTCTGYALGTLLYMAPEQRLDPRTSDLTVDLYGVGTLLFRLATDENPADLFTADAGSVRWEALPEVLRPLVFRATRATPAERWPDARSMAAALLALLPPERRAALLALPGGDPASFPVPANSVRPLSALAAEAAARGASAESRQASASLSMMVWRWGTVGAALGVVASVVVAVAWWFKLDGTLP